MPYNDPARASARGRRYYGEHKDEIAVRSRRYREEHKTEEAGRGRRYREEHKTEIAARKRRRHLENKTTASATKRRYYYGDHFDRLWAEQGGECANAGCRADLTWGVHVDHDHACCPGQRSCGGCVRGLLCPGCNMALGHINDDPRRLQGLVGYLAAHPSPPRPQLELDFGGAPPGVL